VLALAAARGVNRTNACLAEIDLDLPEAAASSLSLVFSEAAV